HRGGHILGARGAPFPDFVAGRWIVRDEQRAFALAPLAADEILSAHHRSTPTLLRQAPGRARPAQPRRDKPRHLSRSRASPRSGSPRSAAAPPARAGRRRLETPASGG